MELVEPLEVVVAEKKLSFEVCYGPRGELSEGMFFEFFRRMQAFRGRWGKRLEKLRFEVYHGRATLHLAPPKTRTTPDALPER